MEQLQALGRNLHVEHRDTRDVPAWPAQAGNQTDAYGIVAPNIDDRDHCRCRLRRQRIRIADGQDHCDPAGHHIGNDRRQSIGLTAGRAIFDCEVATFDQARFFQTLLKPDIASHGRAAQVTNHRHRRLLPPSHERPRRRRAAEQPDELAADHSITSSASASSFAGRGRVPSLSWHNSRPPLGGKGDVHLGGEGTADE